MDAERKNQTLSLLDKLRAEGKPLGRSGEEDVPGEGSDPARDADLTVPYSEQYAESVRKKKRMKRQLDETADQADMPAPVTSSY